MSGRAYVLFLVLGGLLAFVTCGHPGITTSTAAWPTSEGLDTVRAHLHDNGSGAEARALFPDLMEVYVDEALGTRHLSGILPFRYYWSPSGRFTVSICEVGKTVFICPYYLSSRIAPIDFARCDVSPTYSSVELAPKG